MAERFGVLHICSARRSVYGAVNSIFNLMEAQRDEGLNVGLLAIRDEEFAADARERGFPVEIIPTAIKIDPWAVSRMRRAIRSGGWNVVHTHLSTSSLNGGLAARLAQVPSVATVHGMSGKLSFAFSDHLIAVSVEGREHLVRQGVRPDKVSVVPNGVPALPVGDRAEARRLLSIEAGEGPVLGTVARLTDAKGIDLGLEAVARLRDRWPDLRYAVIGDGEARESLEARAATLGVQEAVRWMGYRRDVDRLLPALDVFVFPSRKEAMGMAVVDAMMAGLPIVSSDTGGLPEVVGDAGRLFASGNLDALVTELTDVLEDPAAAASLGRAARARAIERFGLRQMERAVRSVYERLLRG